MEREIKVGNKIPLKDKSHLHIMAYKDKYYMARYKGCVPFVAKIDVIKQILKKRGISPLEKVRYQMSCI